MKLTIHLLDDNRLIVLPNESLSPSQVDHIRHMIDTWNHGSATGLILPYESEIIDMRTPQREQIEAIVNEMLKDYGWIGSEPDGN
jgi:hypothetical protein